MHSGFILWNSLLRVDYYTTTLIFDLWVFQLTLLEVELYDCNNFRHDIGDEYYTVYNFDREFCNVWFVTSVMFGTYKFEKRHDSIVRSVMSRDPPFYDFSWHHLVEKLRVIDELSWLWMLEGCNQPNYIFWLWQIE